ncbi:MULTISPECIES: outer membrane protein [unclassified Bradyrhizobium]|uniref:outer membrane protein n=1 Tax=unclassified Bradyrhizobium TaxID=2631580 RepID=UPI002FF152DB
MRRFLLVAVVCGAASVAQAADMPDLPFLRGSFSEGLSTSTVNWEGGYIGGHAAYGTSNMNFANSTRTMAARLLDGTEMESVQRISEWPIMGKVSAHGEGFGGFVGYNFQWTDVVVGVELNYTHGKFGGSQTGRMSRIFALPSGYTVGATYEGAAQMNISDMGTLRVRGGYAYGSFLPYMFAGIALGQADIIRSARVYGTQVNPAAAPGFQNIPFDVSATDGQYSHLIYGYSFGLGTEVMLMAGLFMRAEWEYVRFASSVDTSINTVRAGLGYKF